MDKEITYQMNLADWPVSDNGSVKRVMSKELNLSRKEISRLKFDGEILLNGERAKVSDHMRVGDTLTLRFPELPTGSITLTDEKPEILYEDEDTVIVNKPAGIPSHPVHGHLNDSIGSVLASYYSQLGEEFVIRPIGRLDKDVSGVLLFAKNRLAASRLSKEREERKLNKKYIAFVSGIFDMKQGMIDAPIAKTEGERRRVTKGPDGKPAVTIFHVINEFHVNDISISQLAVEIETGRTHQIRAHMSAAGHPLIGDELYGGDVSLLKRPALHCSEIEFLTPFTLEERYVQAPLPDDMRALLDCRLGMAAEPAEAEAAVMEEEQNESEEEPVTEEWAEETANEPAVQEGNAGDRILAALQERHGTDSGEEPAVAEKSSGERLRGVLKVLLILILIATLGVLVWWAYSSLINRKRTADAQKELYDLLTITFRKDSFVEYGGDFHPYDYVVSAGGEVSCSGTVDTMRLGNQELLYTVSMETDDGAVVSREYNKVFTVKDVLSPVITLRKTAVTISPNEDYDLEENVISAIDPIDGELAYEIDPGEYIPGVSGTYTIRVTASDQAGNKAEKTYTLTVEGEPLASAEPTASPSASPSASPTPTASSAPADTAAPVITVTADTIVITAGDSFNAGDLIRSVTDETDGTLSYADNPADGSFTVSSDVDPNEAGEYTVHITARDRSGNASEATVVVTVKEPEPTPTPTPKPTEASSAAPEPTAAQTAVPAVNAVPNSSDPKGQIYNFLTGSMGFNKAQACGVLANMHRESRFNSDIENSLGYYGLCQWGGDRKDNLFAWCEANGYDASTIDGQLHFLQYEMPLYYPNTTAQLRACSDDEEGARRACWIFAIGYEVAGEEYAEMSMDKAAEYYNQ